MKPYIKAVLFIISCISYLTAADIDGCILTDKKISCENYHSSTFPYDADYKIMAEITIKGTFSEMEISHEYTKLRKMTFRSPNLTEFNFKPYDGFLKLRAVDVRENNIERVDFTGVHSLTAINQIQLSSNKIKTFDGCADLKEASSLSVLSFQDNELDEIDLNCFPKHLEKLYLNFNNIKTLSPCHPLKSLTSLIRLSVAENQLQVFDFSCIPTSMMSLSMYGNNISQVQNCQDLKSLPRLGRLSLAENNLESFDFSCLPSTLYELFLFDNKLSRVEPCSSLQALTGLGKLTLSQNQLESFDLTCLPKNIINLSLANNSISDISSCETLRNLSRLQNLFLNDNDFVSFNFSCLPQDLTEFDLANNTISEISSFAALSQLPDLTKLSLAHNAISSVEFRHLPQSLKYLHLHDNLISQLDFDLLSQLPWVEISVYDNPIACSCMLLVEYVKAVQNPNLLFKCSNESDCLTCSDFLQSYPWTTDTDTLRSYDDGSMGCFTSYLKEASVSRSNVTITEGCIVEKVHDLLPRIVCNNYQQNGFPYHEDFKDAQSVDIKGDFTSFEINSQYAQLRHIKLGSRSLTAIDMNIFNQFRNLKILDLSSSAIESITPSADLESLDEINLNDNSLSTTSFVGNQSFSMFTSLKRLNLRGNKLGELVMKDFPHQLIKLDVGNNLISEVILDGVEIMTNLKHVDLSYNKLQSFALNAIPASVDELRLNGNQISSINMDPCSDFEALKLDIRDNPLNCSCDLSSSFITALDTCNVALECSINSTCFTCVNPNTNFQTIEHLKNQTTVKCQQSSERIEDDDGSNSVRIAINTLVFVVAILSSLLFML